MAETPQKLQRPKELYIDEKWDKCIDLMVKRTVYGTLAGGAAALLLLREMAAPLCFNLNCCAAQDVPAELLDAGTVILLAVRPKHSRASCLCAAGGAGPRASLTALGAGFGLGSAWEDCHREVRSCCA